MIKDKRIKELEKMSIGYCNKINKLRFRNDILYSIVVEVINNENVKNREQYITALEILGM